MVYTERDSERWYVCDEVDSKPAHAKPAYAAPGTKAKIGRGLSCPAGGKEHSQEWLCHKKAFCRPAGGGAPTALGILLLSFPALTLRLRSGQAGWANFCRASGAYSSRTNCRFTLRGEGWRGRWRGRVGRESRWRPDPLAP